MASFPELPAPDRVDARLMVDLTLMAVISAGMLYLFPGYWFLVVPGAVAGVAAAWWSADAREMFGRRIFLKAAGHLAEHRSQERIRGWTREINVGYGEPCRLRIYCEGPEGRSAFLFTYVVNKDGSEGLTYEIEPAWKQASGFFSHGCTMPDDDVWTWTPEQASRA